MQKIIDYAILSDGTKIQLEDWHSKNSEKYPDLYGYMIGAYPKAKNTGKWGWVRTGETFRLSIGRNEYEKYTDDMVLADYEALKNETKSLADLREHFKNSGGNSRLLVSEMKARFLLTSVTICIIVS